MNKYVDKPSDKNESLQKTNSTSFLSKSVLMTIRRRHGKPKQSDKSC